MSPSRYYQYTPILHLHEIRLLHIKPKEESDVIRFSITHAVLDHNPSYEALSYTWGDPAKSGNLLCTETGTQLAVTQNCLNALQRLQWPDRERILWIDAICIDQENISERNEQVQLMSMIYERADKVLSYLGEDDDDSDIGMDFILEDSTWMTTSQNRPSVGLGSGVTSSPQQKAVDGILERPYFERVWILQEVRCARTVEVVLGCRSVDWNAFSSAVFYVDINKKLYFRSRYHGKPPTVVFYREKSRAEQPETLLQYLNDTRHCKATDPRDKVFGLLGLSPEGRERDLTPDYSVSTHDLFVSTAIFFVTRDRNLDMLCHCQQNALPLNSSDANLNLPSWVPDWSQYRTSRVLGYPRSRSKRPYYKAALGCPASVSFSPDHTIMTVAGKRVDQIADVGALYEMGTKDAIGTLRQWRDLAGIDAAKTDGQADDQNDRVMTAFLETLIASPLYSAGNPLIRLHAPPWLAVTFGDGAGSGGGAESQSQPQTREVEDGQEQNRSPETPPQTFSPSLPSTESSAATIFQDFVNKACHGRRFFVTQTGQMGLGPAEVKRGDTVVVLLGGQVPFLLSEVEGETRFMLVGECYVHGLMGGEAMGDGDAEICEFKIV
jgi:hypothetical protein